MTRKNSELGSEEEVRKILQKVNDTPKHAPISDDELKQMEIEAVNAIERLVKFGTKNITESEILNRAFQIKPITIIPQGQGAGLINDGPWFLNAQAIDLQLDPLDVKVKAGNYEEIGMFIMKTPIGFGHHGRIQPTIAQVLAQIPEEYLGKANAFMFDKPLYTDEHRLVMLDAKTKLFGMQYDIHLYKADLPKEIKEQEVIYKGKVYQAPRYINGQESKIEPKNTQKTCLHGIEPWLDEDLNGDDGSIIEATKITSQSLSIKKDPSRGARAE